MIAIIVNIAQNGAIGYQNKLLYWLPNDMKRFR
ncbi:MAG: dihydrofolate reductase, partial [Opitutales bacterium]|nr:dihydrofolate reductase [Opitutales bacterium]